MKTKKVSTSKIILLIPSILFVIFFVIMLTLSILTSIISNSCNVSQSYWDKLTPFFQWLSQYESISDPFSIFIEILTSIGGVFFGIRIGQWTDDKEEKEKLSELWKKTNIFLKRLKDGINNDQTSIYELAEYKIYWDSLQRADNAATRFLQDDDRYIDISYVFAFLTFYNNSWCKYNSIDDWKANMPALIENRIRNWINSFDDLITYTEKKSHC